MEKSPQAAAIARFDLAADSLEALALVEDPAEPILQLGLMQHNCNTIAMMLARLPKEQDGYRGNLRVIRGAARELMGRVDRLLGET